MFFFAEKLNLRMASEYRYLNQSDCLPIHGVDDARKFHMLMVSLLVVVFVILVHIPYSIFLSPSILIFVFLFLQEALDFPSYSKQIWNALFWGCILFFCFSPFYYYNTNHLLCDMCPFITSNSGDWCKRWIGKTYICKHVWLACRTNQ